MIFGVIDKVAVAMILRNNVSLASLYLDDVRSGVGEGPVRVWSVKFVCSSTDLDISCAYQRE